MRKRTVFAIIILTAICLTVCFAENTIDPAETAAGDIITFGHYAQDTDPGNGTEPVEWVVLDVQDGKALLLSRYGLYAAGYHDNWEDCTWETCSLRAWLNGKFMDYAFTGGNNTQDRLFLLSCAEANRYLDVTIENTANTGSRAAPTAFAVFAGADIQRGCLTADGDAAGRWWLRSPGNHPNSGACVSPEGSLSYTRAYHRNCMVRPAFWLDLNSGIH